jgi:uncharacterized protein
MSRAGLIALVLVALSACSSPQQNVVDASSSDVVRIPVTVDAESGSVTFQSEICDTPEERNRGMMFRTSMGEREGMIFLFPHEQQLSFYMKNTLVSLDMIFIRGDHTILGIIESAVPKSEQSRAVPGNSQFVLEVPGGTSAALGIKPGQNVSFYAPIPSR